MTMNDGVMMISRHRQWRAWQFGRRHSGLFSGTGGTSSGGDNDSDPLNDWMNRQKWWVQLLVYIGFCAFLILLWFSGYMLAFLIFGWVLVWAMRLIIRALFEG